MDESGYVSQRSEEGLIAAYKFEMQLDLLIYCDKPEVQCRPRPMVAGPWGHVVLSRGAAKVDRRGAYAGDCKRQSPI